MSQQPGAAELRRLGVVGGGTMGGGIVQVAAQQGIEVVLLDVRADLLEATRTRINGFLDRAVERGRLTADEAAATMARIHTTLDYADLADADCVIEAVLERIDVKAAVFRSLDEHCRADAILATNTSSLSITEIAATTRRPESVVGLHFFNPPVLMALVEVIRGSATAEATLERATAFVRQIGKTPVRATDTPGFIVNRVVRPFYTEALRLLADGIASHETIDRALRGVGFRMGPFELMDLIGNDVNFAVTSSIYEQFFGEPRYRPSFRQQRLVQRGHLGQKTGHGWYRYDGPSTPATPAPAPAPLSRVLVVGEGALAAQVTQALAAAGVVASQPPAARAGAAPDVGSLDAVVELSTGPAAAKRSIIEALDRTFPAPVPLLPLALTVGTTELASWCAQPARVCGIGLLPPLDTCRTIEVGPGLVTSPSVIAVAMSLGNALGKQPLLLDADSSGLIATRVIALLVNEAAVALTEGVATAEDIDTAVRLGANYPYGPLQWGDILGVDLVYNTLRGLQEETGDDRYRPAPLLRRMALAGWHGRGSGRGFYTYPDSS